MRSIADRGEEVEKTWHGLLLARGVYSLTGQSNVRFRLQNRKSFTHFETYRFRPEADIYTASAPPWDYMNPDLPKFPGLPQK